MLVHRHQPDPLGLERPEDGLDHDQRRVVLPGSSSITGTGLTGGSRRASWSITVASGA
jgi:hypothetical protein